MAKRKTKKRVDGPTIVRGADGEPVLCAFCGERILLVPEDNNIAIEMNPEILGIGVVKRKYRHAFCFSRYENAKCQRV